ncbi:MAG: GreA/GreB family elongation factor [Planctomycetota bacterium]|jgi:transcription elongation factor GreA
MSIPVTAGGKRKMQADLEVLEARVPLVRKAIEEAREKGDLKENAEYHASREELGMLQGSIADLKSRIGQAVVVDESQIDHSIVGFGATVELRDLSDNSVEDWQLVGQGDDDALENKILTTSPMGQALMGHPVGTEVSVAAPMGEIRYKILAITY